MIKASFLSAELAEFLRERNFSDHVASTMEGKSLFKMGYGLFGLLKRFTNDFFAPQNWCRAFQDSSAKLY